MARPPALTPAPVRRRLDSRAARAARVTSLILPQGLHDRARMAAIAVNWSFAEVMRAALTAWLDAHEPKANRKETTR